MSLILIVNLSVVTNWVVKELDFGVIIGCCKEGLVIGSVYPVYVAAI